MNDPATNKKTVAEFLQALSNRDWDGLKPFFTADAHHADMGTSGDGAHGPDAIVARLAIPLDPLEEYELLDGTVLIAEGDVVMAEIKERWKFPSGEELAHPWVSVTELRNGKVFRWHCYSHGGNIVDQAPQWWMEHVINEAVKLGEFGQEATR
jgi:ketosteroid isomerase-like protein